MNWFKENWFKITLLVLIVIYLAIYGYDVYENHQPKSLKEKVRLEMLNR